MKANQFGLHVLIDENKKLVGEYQGPILQATNHFDEGIHVKVS